MVAEARVDDKITCHAWNADRSGLCMHLILEVRLCVATFTFDILCADAAFCATYQAPFHVLYRNEICKYSVRTFNIIHQNTCETRTAVRALDQSNESRNEHGPVQQEQLYGSH